MEKISFEIKTLSNLMIGGTPTSFEIGGIDSYTIVDVQGTPYIPASTLKGVMRRIVHELNCEEHKELLEIKKGYEQYLKKEKRIAEENVNKLEGDDRIQAMESRFEKSISNASAEYLFGIQGFNRAPKIIFNDFLIKDEKIEDFFSIDSKNTIYYNEDTIEANPRSYQTVRPGIIFKGDILLYRMEELKVEGIRDFLIKVILEFNNGIYRLGNSGSRGYGRVMTEIV